MRSILGPKASNVTRSPSPGLQAHTGPKEPSEGGRWVFHSAPAAHPSPLKGEGALAGPGSRGRKQECLGQVTRPSYLYLGLIPSLTRWLSRKELGGYGRVRASAQPTEPQGAH